MLHIFTQAGIPAKAISADTRLTASEFVGGLISIPKLGNDKTRQIQESLLTENIQIDVRTSFGHNTTAVEDVHMQEWSRISVGIEDIKTAQKIARVIATVLQSP